MPKPLLIIRRRWISKLRREDWGSWVDWARPAPGHQAAPSWLDKDNFVPFTGIADIDFGTRSH
jgi:hypothetical protein